MFTSEYRKYYLEINQLFYIFITDKMAAPELDKMAVKEEQVMAGYSGLELFH